MGEEESVSRRATTFLGRHCFGGRWTQPCDLDSRVATTEKDHGEEKDAEQERNEMTIINEHTISSSASTRIESPPLYATNTFCLLPFTSYPVSLEFHRHIVPLNFRKERIKSACEEEIKKACPSRCKSGKNLFFCQCFRSVSRWNFSIIWKNRLFSSVNHDDCTKENKLYSFHGNLFCDGIF